MVRTRTSVYMSVLTTNYHLYIDGQSKEIIHIRQVTVNKANVCMYICNSYNTGTRFVADILHGSPRAVGPWAPCNISATQPSARDITVLYPDDWSSP